MPSSSESYISDIVSLVKKYRPESVLDIGVGFGKWGLLFREYLDIWTNHNVLKSDWIIQIDGVEIFEDYIQAHQRFIYNNIYIGNITALIDGLQNYDLIFMGDVLEHIEQAQARELLAKLKRKSRTLIIAIPLGDNWKQDECFNNPYEEHISQWTEQDFSDNAWHRIYGSNPIGVFLFKNETK